MPLVFQIGADFRRAPVLPDNGLVDGLAGLALPHHRGFALVGDADGSGYSLGAVLALLIAALQVASTDFQISSGSCSTQPESGKYCLNSFWAEALGLSFASKTMARDEVVPWSMARMKSGIALPLRALGTLFFYSRLHMLAQRLLLVG